MRITKNSYLKLAMKALISWMWEVALHQIHIIGIRKPNSKNVCYRMLMIISVILENVPQFRGSCLK